MGLFSGRARQRPQPDGLVRTGSAIWPSQSFAVPAQAWGTTYANIDPTFGETSLQSVAVGAAVDLITSLVSELPVDVFSGSGRDRKQRSTPSYLLDPAGDGYGLEDWVAQVLISWLLRGNLFGDVLARGGGGTYPTQILIYHPDVVGGWVDGFGRVQWTIYGRQVNNPGDFLHKRINPIPSRVLGLSPIASKAATIGLNLTGTQFGLSWFKDGGHPGGILSNEETDLKPEVAKTAKDRFLAALRGNREPAVLGKGWKYQQVQIAPEESQFLETNRWSAAECARIFGPGMAEILGYETGGSLTYVTVEGKSVHLSVYTLNKWMRRVERLLSSMLPKPQYVKLNRAALLETTTLDRYNAYQMALANRWMTVNEVRDLEDMPPVAWGDEPNDNATVKPQIKEKIPTVD
jgi:HK97 family phage portal protein